jgi:hypothetical protein
MTIGLHMKFMIVALFKGELFMPLLSGSRLGVNFCFQTNSTAIVQTIEPASDVLSL